MKILSLLALMLFSLAGLAQTDLIYPWITNNASFQSKIIVNNLNPTSVAVTLTGARDARSADIPNQTVALEIPAFGQRVLETAELFAEMGPGSAFTVRLTSESDNITGAYVNTSTKSCSGSSPSQANVFTAADAGPTWLYNYMFVGGGFAAIAVVNLSDVDAEATVYAYQNGQRVREKTITLAHNRPYADTAESLFPDLTGDMYLVVHSEGASLVGTAFIFNEIEFLEPAMADAIPLTVVPDPVVVSTVSFATQIQPIITASCGRNSDCHLNGGDEEGMMLDAAYSQIVNVTSMQDPTLMRVKPGDPDNSYLMRKLLPLSSSNRYNGTRMPGTGAPLTSDELTLIRTWITEGALNN